MKRTLIIILDGVLSNMCAASNPYLRYTQPACIAIAGIADFDTSSGWTAILWSCTSGDNRCVHYSGLTLVIGCGYKHCIPGPRNIIP